MANVSYWDNQTLLLYVIVALFVGILSFFSEKLRCRKREYSNLLFIICTVILIVFKGIFIGGTDIKVGGGYYNNFMSATSLNGFYDYTVEIGFRMLTAGIRAFTNNYYFYLILIASFAIIPTMFVVWTYRNEINLPFTLMSYTLVFFVTGMSAARQFLAVGLGLLFAYYFVKKRWILCTLWGFAAISIHISAISVLLLLCFIQLRNSKSFQIIFAMFIVLAFVLLRSLIALFFIGRYSIYSAADDIQFGVAVLIKYVPLILLLYFIESKDLQRITNGTHACDVEKSHQKQVYSYCWSVLLFSTTLCLIGYVIPILGRAESYSLPVILIFGFIVRRVDNLNYHKISIRILILLYCLGRLALYMIDYHVSEGLMPYLTWLNL